MEPTQFQAIGPLTSFNRRRERKLSASSSSYRLPYFTIVYLDRRLPSGFDWADDTSFWWIQRCQQRFCGWNDLELCRFHDPARYYACSWKQKRHIHSSKAAKGLCQRIEEKILEARWGEQQLTPFSLISFPPFVILSDRPYKEAVPGLEKR